MYTVHVISQNIDGGASAPVGLSVAMPLYQLQCDRLNSNYVIYLREFLIRSNIYICNIIAKAEIDHRKVAVTFVQAVDITNYTSSY